MVPAMRGGEMWRIDAIDGRTLTFNDGSKGYVADQVDPMVRWMANFRMRTGVSP